MDSVFRLHRLSEEKRQVRRERDNWLLVTSKDTGTPTLTRYQYVVFQKDCSIVHVDDKFKIVCSETKKEIMDQIYTQAFSHGGMRRLMFNDHLLYLMLGFTLGWTFHFLLGTIDK